jgi:hypothetical protein
MRKSREQLKPKNDRFHNALVYHYTYGEHLKHIFADKLLKPTALGVEALEKPAVWFSSNSTFENTAKKKLIAVNRETGEQHLQKLLNHVDMLKYRILPVRFVVKASALTLYNFKSFAAISGISVQGALRMRQQGLAMGGNPNEWFCTFKPVTHDKWLDVQAFNGIEWITLQGGDDEEVGLPDNQPKA